MNKQTTKQINGWRDNWVDGRVGGWMDEGIIGWMEGWMNK